MCDLNLHYSTLQLSLYSYLWTRNWLLKASVFAIDEKDWHFCWLLRTYMEHENWSCSRNHIPVGSKPGLCMQSLVCINLIELMMNFKSVKIFRFTRAQINTLSCRCSISWNSITLYRIKIITIMVDAQREYNLNEVVITRANKDPCWT